MKIFLLLLFIPLISLAQQKRPIDGFNDIKFGSSQADVKAALLAQGADLDATYIKPDACFFNNITFNGHKTNLLAKFYNDKFCQATIMLPKVEDENFMSNYNSVIKELNALYGEGTLFTDFKAPYKLGDGNELEALKNHKASYWASWVNKSTNAADNTVILYVAYDMALSISFMDGELIKQKDAAEANVTPQPKTSRRAKKH